jgi:hypothetical protein
VSLGNNEGRRDDNPAEGRASLELGSNSETELMCKQVKTDADLTSFVPETSCLFAMCYGSIYSIEYTDVPP